MNHRIENELKKIEIPKELHDRVKIGVAKAKSEQPRRKLKLSLVAAAMVSVLGSGILLSPAGQAMFEGLFQVTKFEKSKNNEEISFGYQISNSSVYKEKVYGSLDEVERSFNIDIPFPEQFMSTKNEEPAEYRVGITEEGKFSSYDFRLTTPKRSYSIFATNNTDAKVTFSAETTDGTGVEKDIIINGVPAKLLGIPEMDGYMIYIEKEQWKVVISCFDTASNLKGLSDVKEEEILKVAESITW